MSLAIPGLADAPTKNKKLLEWVEEVAALTKPDRVEWSDGSEDEWQRLTDQMVADGTFIRRMVTFVLVSANVANPGFR